MILNAAFNLTKGNEDGRSGRRKAHWGLNTKNRLCRKHNVAAGRMTAH